MGLRFQGKNSDMERAVKAERIGLIVLLLVLIAGLMAVTSRVKGESLRVYEEAIGIEFVCFAVLWFVWPPCYEILAWAREIHGIVTGIEKSVDAVREDHRVLLERLNSFEKELHSMMGEPAPLRQPRRLPLLD